MKKQVKIRFTDARVAAMAKEFHEKDVLKTDESGMSVYFRPCSDGSVSVSFKCRFSWHGKLKSIVLGRFPYTTVKEARAAYMRLRADLDRGVYPDEREIRPEVRQQTDRTLGSVYNEWYNLKIRPLKRNTQLIYDYLYKNILSRFENLPVKDLSVAWVKANILDAFPDNPTGTTTVARTLHRLVMHCVAMGYLAHDSLSALPVIMPKLKITHHASFEYETLEEDMKALFLKLHEEYRPDTLAVVLCLFLTLLRRMELFNIKRGDVMERDGYRYCVIETKTWEAYKAVITEPAWHIMQWLMEGSPVSGGYIFRRKGSVVRIAPQSILTDLRTAAGITIHGIRSCGRQWMEQQPGIKESTAELCLAHAIGNRTERSYNRGDYITQRVEAMRQWGDFVVSCLPLPLEELFPIQKEV